MLFPLYRSNLDALLEVGLSRSSIINEVKCARFYEGLFYIYARFYKGLLSPRELRHPIPVLILTGRNPAR